MRIKEERQEMRGALPCFLLDPDFCLILYYYPKKNAFYQIPLVLRPVVGHRFASGVLRQQPLSQVFSEQGR